MFHRCLPALLAVAFTLPVAARAHEYWVEPDQYVFTEAGTLTGNLKNGQNFKSSNHSYIPSRFDLFTVTGPSGTAEVTGRAGDVPALKTTLSEPGLYTVSYQGKFDNITFRNPEKIEQYVSYEGFRGVLERHRERGLPDDRFIEKYARCAKALVQLGPADPDGRTDELTGMKFELVAEKNPYSLKKGDTLPVRLYWEGEPMADVQIRTFRFDGQLEEYTTRTDEDGRAMIPLKDGGKFLLNAVHIYEGDDMPDNDIPEWYSYWASMVFGMSDTDDLLKASQSQ